MDNAEKPRVYKAVLDQKKPKECWTCNQAFLCQKNGEALNIHSNVMTMM
jgi:hypothetical protein